jgi:N-acetyl sugar amidotransferase
MNSAPDTFERCSRCVLDNSVPEIRYDSMGVCNYCKLHDQLCSDYPNDDRGAEAIRALTEKMKIKGKGRAYDVIVGVSGGTDSTYLCHLAHELGLRTLAVHLDSGWNSEIAVSNIRKSLDKLGIDLYTHVVDWEEMKDLYRSVLRANIPWPDGVTDIAILGSLFKAASKFGVKYVFVGNNFRTEGRQPDAWTNFDARILKSIHRKFGTKTLKTFPQFTPFHLLYYSIVRGVSMVRPFYFIPYNKAEAKELLKRQYDWQDYGGHHHESIFTRYIIGVWLPQKFKIDKRLVTLSAYVRSGEMDRSKAIATLQDPAYSPDRMQADAEYIAKKLDFSAQEFEAIWKGANNQHTDFPSYAFYYRNLKTVLVGLFRFLLPWRPMMFYDPKAFNQP